MEVILTEDVKNLGLEGEMHEVADGYARNFLFPEGIAVNATEQNKKQFEKEQEELEQRRNKLIEESQELADELETLSLTLEKAAAEEGKLYGSVKQNDLVDALHSEGYDQLRPEAILLAEPISEIGEYTFRVSLTGNVEPEVEVEVVEG